MKDQILRLLEEGRLQEAAPLLARLSREESENPDTWLLSAQLFLKGGRTTEAREALEVAHDLDPALPVPCLLLGNLHAEAGAPDEARAWYRRAESAADAALLPAIRAAVERLDGAAPGPADVRKVAFVCGPDDKFVHHFDEGLAAGWDVRFFHFPKGPDLSRLQEALDWADVVWFEWCDDLLAHASRKLRKTAKVVCRLHRWEAFSQWPQVVDWTFVDRLIFSAEHMRATFAQRFPEAAAKVDTEIVHTGIDLDRFAFTERQPGFDLAYVGYLIGRKNPALLLQCIHALVQKDARYRLHIAGSFREPEWELYVDQMLDSLELRDNVVLHGWVDDISAWLADKQYLVSTSIHEGNPYGIAEAMARGIKPLIHHFVGAEQLYPSEWLFDSVTEFVEQVTTGAYDSGAYRAYIQQHYALADKVEQVDALLRAVVGGAAAPASEGAGRGIAAPPQPSRPIPRLRDLPPPPPGCVGWPWTEASEPLPPLRPDGSPWPRVSLVTPSYNQGRFLEATIRSVLLQGYPDLEYVVVDGGSTDASRAIIEKYAPWLTDWVSESDRGQSDAINKGLSGRTGAYGGWINSDDMLCKGGLAGLMAEAEPGTRTLVAGTCVLVEEDGRERARHRGRVHSLEDLVRIGTVWRGRPRGHLVQPEVLFPLDLFHQLGGLDIENHHVMDYDLWGRLFLAGAGIRYVDVDAAMFRIHEDQKTSRYEETTRVLVETARRLVREHGAWPEEKKRALVAEIEAHGAEVAERYGRMEKTSFDELAKAVQEAAVGGSCSAADALSLRAVGAFPGESRAWVLRANVLRLCERLPEALGAVQRALNLEETPEALAELVEIARSRQDDDEAGRITAYLRQRFPQGPSQDRYRAA